jgi:hypothetical protein
METARVQGISLAQAATPRFSAMRRAVDQHEPTCPCRFVAFTTSSPSPSPWSPHLTHPSIVIAVPDPRLRGGRCVHHGRTRGPRAMCRPAAASGRSCPRRPALRTLPIHRGYLLPCTSPEIPRRLHAPGRCWLVVPSHPAGPAPAGDSCSGYSRHVALLALFGWLVTSQPAVLFSYTSLEPATSHQPASSIFLSQ